MYLLSALVAGILCSDFLTLPSCFLLFTLCLALICAKKFHLSADLLLLLVTFEIGLQLPVSPTHAYTENNIYFLHSRCTEKLPHNNYILTAAGQRFYLSNYNTDTTYHLGDSLACYATIIPLHNNVNPGEFSYSRYLKQKNVYYQIIPRSTICQSGHLSTVRSVFDQWREKIIQKTNRLTSDTLCQKLIQALCLGDRNDLDSKLQHIFMTTGTMHLLSVSGLHTGAIYLLLLFVLRYLGLSGKKTELILIPILWGYASLTGLSPSVVRASTILSFITIGKAFSRTYTPLNSLAASAFFTLLIQPHVLYSLSFLLSYSAYTGIITIYPILFRLPGTLSPVWSKIYACICITLSAQLPTLPISAFYFHTLNLTGFLANLIAVPLATLFLYSSAICLCLPAMIGKYVIWVCELLCHTLVGFLKVFIPFSFNLQDLYPSGPIVLLLYASLISLVGYLLLRKRPWLYTSVLVLLFLFLSQMLINWSICSKSEIVIFHYYRQTAIIFNYKGYYTYLKNTTLPPEKTRPYIRYNKLKALPSTPGFVNSDFYWFPNCFFWRNDTICIADQTTTCYTPCRILIITDNIFPQQLFQSGTTVTYPQIIITDGSNNKYTTQTWYEFCSISHITFRNTFEIGAVCLSLK